MSLDMSVMGKAQHSDSLFLYNSATNRKSCYQLLEYDEQSQTYKTNGFARIRSWLTRQALQEACS